jgi:hypothetical protein
MNTSLFFPVLLVAVALLGWMVFPRRVAHDVAEWELTQQEGRRHVFIYRSWSLGLVIVGVAQELFTLWNQ